MSRARREHATEDPMLKPRSGHRSSGQALPEFAFVIPLLAVIFFGTIQLGVSLGSYNAVINSVREAARYGSICGATTACSTLTAQRAVNVMQGGVIAYKTGSERAIVSYQTYQDAAGKYNVSVKVTACVRGLVFFPLVGDLLGWTDPSGVVLSSSETFRVENRPRNSAPSIPGTYKFPNNQATCS